MFCSYSYHIWAWLANIAWRVATRGRFVCLFILNFTQHEMRIHIARSFIFGKTLGQILWQGRLRTCSFFSVKLKAKHWKTCWFFLPFSFNPINVYCTLMFVLLPFRKRLMVLVVLYVCSIYIQEIPAFRDFWCQRLIMKFRDHKFWGLFLV